MYKSRHKDFNNPCLYAVYADGVFAYCFDDGMTVFYFEEQTDNKDTAGKSYEEPI